jgi:hypothetical protein
VQENIVACSETHKEHKNAHFEQNDNFCLLKNKKKNVGFQWLHFIYNYFFVASGGLSVGS